MNSNRNFCSNCGTKLIPGSSYCIECGEAVGVPPEEAGQLRDAQGQQAQPAYLPPRPPPAQAFHAGTPADAPSNAYQPSPPAAQVSHGPAGEKGWRMIGALLIALGGVLFVGVELFRFVSAAFQGAGDVLFEAVIAVIVWLVSLLVLKSTTRKKLVTALILSSLLAVLSIPSVWERIDSIQFYLHDDFFIESIQNDTSRQSQIVGQVIFGMVGDIVLGIGCLVVIAGSIRDLRARKV